MESDPELFDEDDGNVANTFLTFYVESEEYAVSVAYVTEIVRLQKTFAIPDVPKYIRGVINLRGKVIPVIDLRLKFNFEAKEATDRTAIIVVELELPGGRTLVGVLVDAVSEVLNVTGEEVEATPTFGDQVDTTFMRGVAKVKGTVKILLDLDRVFEAEGSLPRLAA